MYSHIDIDIQKEFLTRTDARQLAFKAVACAIEAGDLEAAVAKKKGEIASSANPIIKVRSHLDDYASGELINRTSASV